MWNLHLCSRQLCAQALPFLQGMREVAHGSTAQPLDAARDHSAIAYGCAAIVMPSNGMQVTAQV